MMLVGHLIGYLCKFSCDTEVEVPTNGGMTRWIRIQEHDGKVWISPALDKADRENPYYFEEDQLHMESADERADH